MTVSRAGPELPSSVRVGTRCSFGSSSEVPSTSCRCAPWRQASWISKINLNEDARAAGDGQLCSRPATPRRPPPTPRRSLDKDVKKVGTEKADGAAHHALQGSPRTPQPPQRTR